MAKICNNTRRGRSLTKLINRCMVILKPYLKSIASFATSIWRNQRYQQHRKISMI